MTGWLLRMFVKNHQNTQDQTVRASYASLAAVVGIALNLLLATAKMLTGLFIGSVAVTADGANNLSDAGGSIVSLVSTRMAQKPGDKDHPFGHGRMEYIGALGVGALILVMGVELLKAGIKSIAAPTAPDYSLTAWVALAGSILLKGWLYFFYTRLGRAVDSPPLIAAGKDSVSDVLASFGVILGMLAFQIFKLPADGYVGTLVALVVLKTGFGVCKGTVDRLLGARPSQETNDRIMERLLPYDGILGVHDLVIHDYGPGRILASVHAEVSAKADILKVHELIDHAERDISKEMSVNLLIHMDPVVTDDKAANEAYARMETFLKAVDQRLKIHDFRRVPSGEKIRLLFDVVVPADFGDTEPLRRQIEAYARGMDESNECVLHFDLDYYH